MINLLPDGVKQDMVYGRRNLRLMHATLWLVVVILGLVIVVIFGQWYLTNAQKTYAKNTSAVDARIQNQNLESTQKDIQTLSGNFKTVVQILGKQVLFSKLFEKIGSTIPSGSILTGLTLTDNNSALDLTIAATSRDSANQAYINIADPKNELFEKADLIGITCVQPGDTSSGTTDTASKYPCQATIKVLFKANSSFLFLNSVTGKTGATK